MPLTDSIIPLYTEAYRKHGKSPAALLFPKGRQHLRFAALSTAMTGGDFSVLDFGCGFADLWFFLTTRHGRLIRYTGVDVMPEFIEHAQYLYGADTCKLIGSHYDVRGEFDYVVAAGVFNTLYLPTDAAHWEAVKDILRHLFTRTRRAMSFDFQTDRVDFKADSAFHIDPLEVYRFAERELSHRVKIDTTYMPYEFAVTVFKDATIRRPANVYREYATGGQDMLGLVGDQLQRPLIMPVKA